MISWKSTGHSLPREKTTKCQMAWHFLLKNFVHLSRFGHVYFLQHWKFPEEIFEGTFSVDIGKEKCYSARHLARFSKELTVYWPFAKTFTLDADSSKGKQEKMLCKKSGCPALGMVKKLENKNILHKVGTCSKKKERTSRTPNTLELKRLSVKLWNLMSCLSLYFPKKIYIWLRNRSIITIPWTR